jgi:hypothetical protein
MPAPSLALGARLWSAVLIVEIVPSADLALVCRALSSSLPIRVLLLRENKKATASIVRERSSPITIIVCSRLRYWLRPSLIQAPIYLGRGS